MSKKITKQKRRFPLPKRNALTYILLFLIPIVLFFVIAIPVVYVNEYKATKAKPFASTLESNEEIASKVVYGDGDVIPDFNFILYCKTYSNDSDKNTITFSWFAYRNDQTSSLFKDTDQISVSLSLTSNWLGNEYTSSSLKRRIAKTPKEALGSTTYRADSQTISGVPHLPYKTKLAFTKVKKLDLYAYVTYTTTVKGTKTDKYFILKYEFDDYMTDGMVFDAGTENEVYVKASSGSL